MSSCSSINNNGGVTGRLKELVQPEIVTVPSKVASAVRYLTNASKDIASPGGKELLSGLRFFAIVYVPLAIHSLANSIFDLLSATDSSKVDAGLTAVSEVGNLGDATATFCKGLGAVGLVAAEAVSWATPLCIASSCLTLAGVVVLTKHIAEKTRFQNKFVEEAGLVKNENSYTLEDFKKGINFVKEGSNTKKFYDDETKLMERLSQIQITAEKKLSSQDKTENEEGQKILHTTMNSLKNRISTKKWSDALSLLAAAVGLIGFVIIFTPLAPVGLALLGISPIISLGNLAYRKIRTQQFEEALSL